MQGIFIKFRQAMLSIALCSLASSLYAEILKECEDDSDKQMGCIEINDEGLRSEIPYKDGKIHGISKIYYPTGELLQEMTFKNGKFEGYLKTYYRNGSLLSETPYKDGEVEGISKFYHQNGGLAAAIPYKNNKINGIIKLYERQKVIMSVSVKDNKFISAKCSNGKALTNAHLAKITKDIKDSDNLALFDTENLNYWLEICK